MVRWTSGPVKERADFLFHRIKSHSIEMLQRHAPPGAACPDDICRVTTRSEKRRQLRHQQGGRGGQPRQLQRDIFTQVDEEDEDEEEDSRVVVVVSRHHLQRDIFTQAEISLQQDN